MFAFSFNRQYGILRDLTKIRNCLLKIITLLEVYNNIIYNALNVFFIIHPEFGNKKKRLFYLQIQYLQIHL